MNQWEKFINKYSIRREFLRANKKFAEIVFGFFTTLIAAFTIAEVVMYGPIMLGIFMIAEILPAFYLWANHFCYYNEIKSYLGKHISISRKDLKDLIKRAEKHLESSKSNEKLDEKLEVLDSSEVQVKDLKTKEIKNQKFTTKTKFDGNKALQNSEQKSESKSIEKDTKAVSVKKQDNNEFTL